MQNYTQRVKQVNLIRVAHILAVVWVILSLSDAVVTYICLLDRDNVEGNPFARSLLENSEVLFYGAKLLVTAGVGLGFWMLATRTAHLKPMIFCQLFLVVMFAAVLGNNVMHI